MMLVSHLSISMHANARDNNEGLTLAIENTILIVQNAHTNKIRGSMTKTKSGGPCTVTVNSCEMLKISLMGSHCMNLS